MKPYFNYTLVVIFSLMATFLFPQDASARRLTRNDPRVEMRAGISGYPIVADMVTGIHGCYDYKEEFYYGDLLRNLYSDSEGNLISSGNFHFAAGYRFTGWFTLSGYMMYNQFWQNKRDAITGKSSDTEWSHAFALAPEAKFTFMNKRYVQLYGSLSAGLTFYKSPNAAFMEYELYPHIQVVPFGISTGRRFFGFTELGYGTEFIGLRAGLGLRF